MLLLDAPTSAEKRRARCDPGLDVLERGEEDGLEGGTSETTGGAIWVRGLDVRVARENVTEPAQEGGGRVKFSQGIGAPRAQGVRRTGPARGSERCGRLAATPGDAPVASTPPRRREPGR